MGRSITPKKRFEVMRRDGFRCVYCGAAPSDRRELVIDHVRPVIKGGSDRPSNLVTACERCNSGKFDRLLSAPLVEAFDVNELFAFRLDDAERAIGQLFHLADDESLDGLHSYLMAFLDCGVAPWYRRAPGQRASLDAIDEIEQVA